jgi:hypothetical protein
MTSHVAQAVLLAEGNGTHDTLKPWLTGGGALAILLLLLVVTVSFNKDR